jgi:hypothetical protein
MEHGEARILELGGVAGRASRRCGDEVHALGDDEVHDDRRIGDECLGDVDPERLVGQILHFGYLVTNRVQLS